MERLLKAQDVAEAIQVAVGTAYRLMQEMHPVHFGHAIRVTEAGLNEWIEKHSKGSEQTRPMKKAAGGIMFCQRR